MPATTLPPENIPLEFPSHFTPTSAYYFLHHAHTTTTILDLSPNLPILYAPLTGLSLAVAESLSTSSGDPFPPVLYTLKKENLLGTHFIARDEKGIQVAEWKKPVLHLGVKTTKITFLHPDQHLDGGEVEEMPVIGEGRKLGSEIDHPEMKSDVVEVKPAGVGRRAEEFTKNDSRYIWEVERHIHEHKLLYKKSHLDTPVPQKHLVGLFSQPHSHQKDGLLVLDEKEIDPLTGILTLCAMLEAKKAATDGYDEGAGTKLERILDKPVMTM